MRMWILLFALMLVVGNSFAATVTLQLVNCSLMKVTTDAGANGWVTIWFYGNEGFQPATAERATHTNGEVTFPTELNGTHQAKMRLSQTSSTYYTSNSLEITTCLPPKACTGKSDCNSGEICLGGVCQTGDCVSNNDCPTSKNCTSNHTCETVACACGEVKNHACVAYECCADSDCGQDQVCTSHTCREKTQPADPAAQEASTAITDAQAAVDNADAAGKDVSGAGILLSSAREKYSEKNYTSAKTLANNAKSVALALMGGSVNNGTAGNGGAAEQTGSFSLGSPLCILGIFIAVGVIIAAVFLLIIGIVIYREKRKRR